MAKQKSLNTLIDEQVEIIDAAKGVGTMGATLTEVEEQYVTKEKMQLILGKRSSVRITDEVMSLIAGMGDETDLDQSLLEYRLLSTMHILNEVKLGLPQYIQAIKYCTLKQNMSNLKAYTIVYPGKVHDFETKRLAREGTDNPMKATLDSKVSQYNSSEIVNRITKELNVDLRITYASQAHKAMNVVVGLMHGKCKSTNGEDMQVSPKTRLEAASKVLDVLAPDPVVNVKGEIVLADEARSFQTDMLEQVAKMAQGMQARLAGGESIGAVQKTGISFNKEEDIIDV